MMMMMMYTMMMYTMMVMMDGDDMKYEDDEEDDDDDDDDIIQVISGACFLHMKSDDDFWFDVLSFTCRSRHSRHCAHSNAPIVAVRQPVLWGYLGRYDAVDETS